MFVKKSIRILQIFSGFFESQNDKYMSKNQTVYPIVKCQNE